TRFKCDWSSDVCSFRSNIRRACDLPGDEVSAEPGGEHTEPRELARVALGAAERQVSPERDAAEPHRADPRPCRREQLPPQLRERSEERRVGKAWTSRGG